VVNMVACSNVALISVASLFKLPTFVLDGMGVGLRGGLWVKDRLSRV